MPFATIPAAIEEFRAGRMLVGGADEYVENEGDLPAHPIGVAMGREAKAGDLARPGHIFPLRAREGGVLVRAGQTEAAVDLARMAGLEPGGVICEIMNPDGSMARVPQLSEFCA